VLGVLVAQGLARFHLLALLLGQLGALLLLQRRERVSDGRRRRRGSLNDIRQCERLISLNRHA
jgi:hypothetical protein